MAEEMNQNPIANEPVDTNESASQGVHQNQEPSTESAIVPDTLELQRELDTAKRAKAAAEKALELEKKAHSTLKRQHMSEGDLLAEKTREMEEKAKMYDRQANAFTAEKIFATAGLKNDDYDEILNLIVSEDTEKTQSTAQAIAEMLAFQRTLTERSIREKVLKEMPLPPAGDPGKTVDLFMEGFKNG